MANDTKSKKEIIDVKNMPKKSIKDLEEEITNLKTKIDTLTIEKEELQRDLNNKNYLNATYLDTISTINQQSAIMKQQIRNIDNLQQMLQSGQRPLG